MSDPMMTDQARLVDAGWKQALSGRWFHDNVPAVAGRRRLFTTGDALALLDADPSNTNAEEATA